MQKMKKESLIKIINLYEFVEKKSIIDKIIEEREKISDKSNIAIFNIRVSSLLESIQQKYIDKEENEEYALYEYIDKKIVYLKIKKDRKYIAEVIEKDGTKKKKIRIYLENGKIIQKIEKLTEEMAEVVKKIIITK